MALVKPHCRDKEFVGTSLSFSVNETLRFIQYELL